MRPLYEIDADIMDAYEKSIDYETGEIMDTTWLDQLLVERDRKIEGVSIMLKNKLAEQEMIETEIDRLTTRSERAKKTIEGLKGWLSTALDGVKFETAKVSVSFRNVKRTNILDESLIPAIYKREIPAEYKIDKVALKRSLMNGEKIPGVELEERKAVVVK